MGKWDNVVHREFKTCEHQIFFVKDHVDKGELSIEYCLTHLMITDYFTNPLQGKVFRAMIKVIMGHEPLSWFSKELLSTKERVGKK